MAGNKELLLTAVINILQNACKFSQNGPVKVTLKRAGVSIAIHVQDNGLGIIEDDISKIFDKFYQSKHVSERTGLGLGLYLSKKIVESHNGDIQAFSTLGVGSLFVISLPAS